MQFRLNCLDILLLVLVTACSPAPTGQTTVVLEAQLPASPTAPPPPAATPTRNLPSPSAVPTFEVSTITPDTSPPLPAVLPLCTPLQGHPLEDLPSILTQPFQAPRAGRDDGHHGVDFAYYQYRDRTTLEGVVVQPLLEGVVAAAVPNRIPYGNMVMVASNPDHLPPQVQSLLEVEPGQTLYTLYAHLAEPASVAVGATVNCGQKLGSVGNTGWSGNPHLHLETRLGPAGRSFESMAYYDTRATEEERENYELWRMSGEFVLVDPMILIDTYLTGNW